jgi:leucyl-tRNA synthetase
MKPYDHKKIEKKWQKEWAKKQLYKASDSKNPEQNEYVLFEFPYPSGNLHVGHWYAMALPDIYARKKRMEGKNVLYPVGFDAFGLPAENAAIKRGLDPKKWTYGNIKTMRAQLETMGASFDTSREIITSDSEYYSWTQWLFTKMFERGLAYRKKSVVNWDPVDKTVLANEQVLADGTAERSGAKVEKRDLEQWFLKITDYADRLVKDLDSLDWPEEIKQAQRNWIGKSEGAEFEFQVKGLDKKIKVFTTRADTLFGVTYIVLAAEHSLIGLVKSHITNSDEVWKYISNVSKKTEIDRTAQDKEKTGIELKGIKAIHPITQEELPIWVGDYVLVNYGTGAIMAVPAHDERDFQFAKKYNLPIKEVVVPNIIDKRNPPVPGKKTVERKNVHPIVRDPKTGKYLALKWKKFNWTTFPMGGIEEGEDVVTAAKREIQEETGFINMKLVKILDGQTRAEYFAAHKDQNRISFTTAVIFDLVDHEQIPIAQAEKDQHEVIWLDQSQLNYDHMTHAEVEIWNEKMQAKHGAYTGKGILLNSDEFDGMDSEEARKKIAEKFGKVTVTYKLRDWSIGRQRYWGTPVPIVYDPEGKPHVIPEKHLPWKLPTDVDHTPTGEPPLARSKELAKRTEKIFGKGWKPDVETMDTFVDSSWYYIRYTDPHNKKNIADQKKIKNWLPVDYYFGGAEHTTLHLLYSRFFYKVMHDIGLVENTEPFTKRLNRGLILGPDGNKMSKSKGNVVNPDEIVAKLGEVAGNCRAEATKARRSNRKKIIFVKGKLVNIVAFSRT